MKLLLLTAVKEFEKDIKQILKKSGVKSFSYRDVNGFKDSSEEAMEGNWFATNMQENESVLFYAFVEKGNVDTVFDIVAKFNEKQKTASHIHLAMLNIEKSN
jgi:nitrogen regulatory protein PII